jgi:hypothetical protein
MSTNGSDVLAIAVECYAGHRGDETPRAFTLGGRRIVVDEVTDRWLAPAHRYFKLKDAGSHTYIIRHDMNTDRWELTLFQQ